MVYDNHKKQINELDLRENFVNEKNRFLSPRPAPCKVRVQLETGGGGW